MHMSYFGYDAVGILISSAYANESFRIVGVFPFYFKLCNFGNGNFG